MTANEYVQQVIVDLFLALLVALIMVGFFSVIAFVVLTISGESYPLQVYPIVFLAGLLFAFIGLRLISRRRRHT